MRHLLLKICIVRCAVGRFTYVHFVQCLLVMYTNGGSKDSKEIQIFRLTENMNTFNL